MQIIDTDSINYPFVQICVIGGVFLFGTRQSLLQVNTQSSWLLPYHMPDLPCNNCVCGVA